MSRATVDWDALAPYWECFEDGGFNRRALGFLEATIVPPLLFVGGGRGLLPARLTEQFGSREVIVVDRSIPMCKRARNEFRLQCAAADVTTLPFRTGVFRTVLCTTGILEAQHADTRVGSLSEMGRVCLQAGQLLVTAACVDEDNDSRVDMHRLLERSYRGEARGSDPFSTALTTIANRLGSGSAAYELLTRSLPRFAQMVTPDQLVAAATRARLEVAATFQLEGVGIWKLTPQKID